jgi:hypothetical protein
VSPGGIAANHGNSRLKKGAGDLLNQALALSMQKGPAN